MTYYVHIDKPAQPRALPKAWHNVSGLNTLTDADLAVLGWFPWESTPQPAHDEIHEYLQSGTEINDGRAVQTWAVMRREHIPTVADIVVQQTAAIKAAAGDAIIARWPLHTQINLTARAAELLKIRNERPLTQEELGEQVFLEGVWAWINRQRAESNRLEASIAVVQADEALTDDEKRTAVHNVTFVAVP